MPQIDGKYRKADIIPGFKFVGSIYNHASRTLNGVPIKQLLADDKLLQKVVGKTYNTNLEPKPWD